MSVLVRWPRAQLQARTGSSDSDDSDAIRMVIHPTTHPRVIAADELEKVSPIGAGVAPSDGKG